MSNKRFPIYLNRHTVALIHIFTRPDELEDLWITDYPMYNENYEDVAKNAAKQFIDQLQGRWTPRFLKALRDEIEQRLND